MLEADINFTFSGTQFSSLTELIEHYQRSDDGLPTRLVGFCKGRLAPTSVLKRENTKVNLISMITM